MKNKFLITMAMIFLLGSLINVSAIQYYQTKSFQENNITRVHGSLFWDFGGLTENYIKSGEALQTYVLYNIYPSKWNEDNPNYEIEYCNFTIEFFEHMDSSSKIVYNKFYDLTTDDDFERKYFVEIGEGDGYTFDVDCSFIGIQPNQTEMPVTISVVTPTWECKACQEYEWSLLEQDVAKTKSLGENTSDVMDYIKSFFLLNFEIFLALFWIILIAIGFWSFSLIFVGIYWLYLYMKGIAKRST